MNDIQKKLLVDLNFPELYQNMRIFGFVCEIVGGFKLGEVPIHYGLGPAILSRLRRAQKGGIFYDGKLIGTPDTTVPIVEMLKDFGVNLFTVGMQAGRSTFGVLARIKKNMKLLGVTHLTSRGDVSIDKIIADTQIVLDWGADGVVCAPPDVLPLRAHFPHILLVATGVRPIWSPNSSDDHVRFGTPSDAALADYVIVGRPITMYRDPAYAAELVVEEIRMTIKYPDGMPRSFC